MLRIGIIGFGGAGTAHAGYFSCVPGCVVRKIYNPHPDRLEAARQLFPQVERHGTLDSFWSDLDAVSVCTPDATHADYIVAALERGLHVICEKPLTDSEAGIRKIKRATARSDRVVACLHQMRFVPLFRKIKRVLEARELGAVSYLEGYYVHNLVHRAFVNDDWRRRDNATPLVYSGCHFVDLLRWFADEDIVEVFAAANHLGFPEYPESDFNLVTLRFKSGVIGKVVVAFGAAGPQDHSIRIYGNRRSIDNNVLFNDAGGWEGILHEPIIIQRPLLRHPIKTMHYSYGRQLRSNLPAWLLGKIFLATRFLARRPNSEYGGRYYPVRLYEHALACVTAIEDFVQAIRQKRAPLCTFDEAAKTVLACLAGVESYRTNRPVPGANPRRGSAGKSSGVKPVVVHLVETFLGRSEVFIHNYVSSHVNWNAVVLCKFTGNETEFPISRRVVIPAPVSKRQPAWWIEQTADLVTGRNLWHRRVELELRKMSPKVIHAHFGQMGHAILPVKQRLGLPLVTTFYGYDMSVLPRLPGWRAKLADLFRTGDLFLTEGAFMRDRLIELGAPKAKVRIQRIAIHVDRYPAWQPVAERSVVLFVGRFVEKKGLLLALIAVRDVFRHGHPLHFRVVGDGADRAAAAQFVAENGLADVVEFLGMKSHAEVLSELAKAHVLLHPSRTAANGDSEGGAPTILLEAQAVGIAIVSTLHADIPNVVGAGRGIYLSPENDSAQLAQNLREALQRHEGSDPAFVRENHDVGQEIINLENIYREVQNS